MQKRIVKIAFALTFLILAAFFLWAFPEEEKQQEICYYRNTGYVFGTYYNIRYQNSKDLHAQIKEVLEEFDNSMSAFNKESVLSNINYNKSNKTDRYFEQMYETAHYVSELTNGAFDITVAPLVNAWGFGFENQEQINKEIIDSLRQYVGYQKINLQGHKLYKQLPQIKIDCGAIAKGQGCDVVAELLEKHDCKNYLVDIGGEVVCKGVNEQDKLWRVGITRPTDDPEGTNQELQTIVSLKDMSMATSGNYRQFYYENGVRRSHTIDPRTGYPVNHSLLSATVVAPSCMLADALATSCMVLGTDSALLLINSLDNAECYLIYAVEDTTAVVMTPKFNEWIEKQ